MRRVYYVMNGHEDGSYKVIEGCLYVRNYHKDTWIEFMLKTLIHYDYPDFTLNQNGMFYFVTGE